MQENLQAQVEQQKLDAMKELAYGASHEINNPLANIAARAQALLRDEEAPERRRALEAIHQQAMRAHEMISDLMLFARPPRLQVEAFDFRTVLNDVTDDLTDECQRRDVQLLMNLPESPLELHGDQQQLTVAVSAVVLNALEAIGRDGQVKVELRKDSVNEPGDIAILEVIDTGPGISDEVRRHLFDPFFSGREAGRGLGFGLSKCWRIVTDHGGTVAVSGNTQQGTTISLQIPIHALAKPDPPVC